MIRYGIIATIALLVAATVMATFRSNDTATSVSSDVVSSIPQGDIQQRLAALESMVLEEQQRRVAIEEQLSEMEEQNRWLSDQLASGSSNFEERVGSDDNTPVQNFREQLTERRSDADQGERTEQRLISAGFDEFEAAEIVRITEELQMRRLNAVFQAEQTGERVNVQAFQAEATQELKDRLGEADYEKYLEAMRRPTSVDVRNVLESSPAQLAGLQSGDEIVRYGGERVYNVAELNRLTSTNESDTVLVEVIRDGQPITVSLPAGPIGITSRSRGGF